MIESTDKQSKTGFIRSNWIWAVTALLCLVVGVQAGRLLQQSQQEETKEPQLLLQKPEGFEFKLPLDHRDVFKEFESMQQEMDSLFENRATPSFDLKEDNTHYRVTLKLPGLNESKVNVSVEEQTLKISGTLEKIEEREEKGRSFRSSSTSTFQRSATLPGPVKPDTLNVDAQKDILRITIEKK